MKKAIIATLFLCFSLACEGDRGPMGNQGATGSEGPQGPPGLDGPEGSPGEDIQIISIVGRIGSVRSYGFFEIWNSIIRADDVVNVYMGVDSPIINWGSCQYVYGDGFAWIYDPDYSLTGWYYLVRIIPNPDN